MPRSALGTRAETRPPDCAVTCQRLTTLPFLIALTVTACPTDSDREETITSREPGAAAADGDATGLADSGSLGTGSLEALGDGAATVASSTQFLMQLHVHSLRLYPYPFPVTAGPVPDGHRSAVPAAASGPLTRVYPARACPRARSGSGSSPVATEIAGMGWGTCRTQYTACRPESAQTSTAFPQPCGQLIWSPSVDAPEPVQTGPPTSVSMIVEPDQSGSAERDADGGGDGTPAPPAGAGPLLDVLPDGGWPAALPAAVGDGVGAGVALAVGDGSGAGVSSTQWDADPFDTGPRWKPSAQVASELPCPLWEMEHQ